MSRRVDRLTPDHLDDLVVPCSNCVRWQLDPVLAARVCGHERDELATWVSTVLREWGSCGRIVYVDDQPAGHVLYAPARHAPGADRFATAPVSPDAVLMLAVRVAPAYADKGLGRVLVQALAKDLIQRGGIRAIEAFGTSSLHPEACLVPTEFLRSVGFRTQRAHPRTPRMRMDLRSVLSWRSEIESALDRLLAPVRQPASAPVRRSRPHAPHPPALPGGGDGG